MGQKQSGLNCCAQEGYLASTAELAFDNSFLSEHYGEDGDGGLPHLRSSHGSSSGAACHLGVRPGGAWGNLDDAWCVRDTPSCVVDEYGDMEGVPQDGKGGHLESLSYSPVRFDEGTTVDAERSQARYSKIVVHSARARTQRRTRAWEDWLRGATAGRRVTLVGGDHTGGELAAGGKVPAVYHLDRQLAKLTLRSADAKNGNSAGGGGAPASANEEAWQIVILVDNIQVICPATDFMFFFDQADAKLDDAEKARAVLLQYMTEDSEKKRVCFLEETDLEKERFIQALTALWLEKRNDHSMWF